LEAVVSSQSDPRDVHFDPLRPASRRSIIAALIIGPILWLVALIVGAIVFKYSDAVAAAVAVAAASFLIALLVLNVLLSSRRRQERRYVRR
jgi:membrane protein implicated in regulation of membrane protease activity